MKYRILTSIAIFGTLFSSCTEEQPKTEETTTEIVETTIDSNSTKVEKSNKIEEQKSFQSGDTLTIEGTLTQFGEAELGPSHLFIDVDGESMSFENQIMDLSKIKSLIGKNVNLKYVYNEIIEETDLHVDGTSIHGKYGSIVSDEDKISTNIEGTLTITEYDISGDSPTEYILTKADGTELKITAFVSESMLALNGKKATLYYSSESVKIAIDINSTESETIDDKINFVKEKFGIITSKMDAKEYAITEFQIEDEGTFVQYKRAMDGNDIRFVSVSNCSDHGCDKTSYYFWNDLVFFQFQENSHWVGNTDNITEKRMYYHAEEEIRCLQREISATGGYDAVKKKLSSVPQTTLPHGEKFNRESIKNFIDLTEEVATQSPSIFY